MKATYEHHEIAISCRDISFHPSTSIMAGSKLVLEGRVSIYGFILGLSVVVIPLIRTWFGRHDWVFDYLTETPGKMAFSFHIAVINGLLLLIYRGPLYKVGTDIRKPTFCFTLKRSDFEALPF